MAARARTTLSLLQAADAGSRDLTPETRRSVALVLDYIRNGEFASAHETVDQLKAADATIRSSSAWKPRSSRRRATWAPQFPA